LKSTQGVHFTILPASPCAAEFYEIWHMRSTHQRNHVCQIFSRSVQGLRSSDTPKIAISHRLAALHLQQCSTAVRHCENGAFWGQSYYKTLNRKPHQSIEWYQFQ